DPLMLRRILDNLVTNAVESLAGRAGTITVTTERANGHARLVVRDTGKGMTRPELDRAFDDFYSTKPGGTGLGLSIVRRLVVDARAARARDRVHGHRELRPLCAGDPPGRGQLHRQGRVDGAGGAGGRASARAAAPGARSRRAAPRSRLRPPARRVEPRAATAP